MNRYSFAVLAGLLATAQSARADMPPAMLVGVSLELSTSAVAFVRGKQVGIPGGVHEAYIWRTSGDPEIDFSAPFSAGKIATPRNSASIEFSLAKDVFEISNPRPVVIVTGHKSRVISTNDIVRVTPYKGSLHGRIIYPGQAVTLAPEWAALLKKGPPLFSCQIGFAGGYSSEELIVSYNPKVGKKALGSLCASDPSTTPRPTSAQIESALKHMNVFLMEFVGDA